MRSSVLLMPARRVPEARAGCKLATRGHGNRPSSRTGEFAAFSVKHAYAVRERIKVPPKILRAIAVESCNSAHNQREPTHIQEVEFQRTATFLRCSCT
jgi:hypothetical protein